MQVIHSFIRLLVGMTTQELFPIVEVQGRKSL